MSLEDYQNEDNEDNEDYQNGDENIYIAERDAFDRVGQGRANEIISIGNKSLSDITKLLGKFVKNEGERFEIILSICFNKFKQELFLEEEQLEKIYDLTNKIPNLYLKNPVGILFGYSVVKNSKIDKKKFEKIQLIKNSELNPEDIIRYARLIISVI